MSNDINTLLGASTSSAPTNSSITGVGTTSETPFASSVMARYRDAYLVARVTTGFGSVIKGIGYFLAFIIFTASLVLSGQVNGYGSESLKTMYFLTGLILAGIVGAIFYLFGVLVSAQGQILKASLDGAVNGSPFLNDLQKANVMSLK